MTSVMTQARVAAMLRPRPQDAHKGTVGHALLWAGRAGVGGCAVLAAESCMRSGVGKLTVVTPECNRLLLQLSVPEAVLQVLSADAADAPWRQAVGISWWQAMGIGPGIGVQADALLADALLCSGSMPVVLDADALRILARHPEWREHVRGRAVLTPHGGEMQSLAQGLLHEAPMLEDGEWLQKAAARMASDWGVWVLLKGHPTHVYHPDGSVMLCPRGNAGMATAGAGDVLTGIITGLMAQGYAPGEAACMGAWLHATAGDHAAAALGQEAMIARDITAHMSGAWQELHRLSVVNSGGRPFPTSP